MQDSCNASGDAFHAFLWKDDGTPLLDLGPFKFDGWPNGDGFALALNDAGQVTGYVGGFLVSKAFLWRNDGTPMRALGMLGGAMAKGRAINNSGQIVGVATPGTGSKTHAVLWRNGGPIVDLGTLGGTWSGANAENKSGQVTGFAYTSFNSRRAFIWKNDGTPMRNLGTLGGDQSEGWAINSSGQVAGYSRVRKGQTEVHAFLWRNNGTAMVDLGTLGTDSQPYAINDSGQVVGFSTAADGFDHAFVWRNDGTPMRDLGTAGGPNSYAYGINSSGWVVGYAGTADGAFLWRNDGKGVRNLNDLVDPADPLKPFLVLNWAADINDAGDIMAYGADSRVVGLPKTYLLRTSALALEPHALAFGNQRVGTESASKSITVQNRSTSAVAITSIALAGAGASQFARTDNCASSVPPKGSCTIKATFKPTTKGAKMATLSVNGGGGGLRVVNLTGTGG